MPIAEEAETEASIIFPLSLVLEGVEYAADGVWRPDWPPELPPDALDLSSSGVFQAAVTGEGWSLNLLFDGEGRVVEFPFMLNGKMSQVSVNYREDSLVNEISLAFFSEDDIWKLEFQEYWDAYPALARCSRGGEWFFVAFSRTRGEIVETWYDEEGQLEGAYGYTLTEVGNNSRITKLKNFSDSSGNSETEFVYDSWGLNTEISGQAGSFRVLYYRDNLPRYWEQIPPETDGEEKAGQKFYLQWDENGLLVRLSSGEEIESRYEYTLDEKGNWIERRETKMTRAFGLLVPSRGETYTRVLEYEKSE